jgi:hypothetical protein
MVVLFRHQPAQRSFHAKLARKVKQFSIRPQTMAPQSAKKSITVV